MQLLKKFVVLLVSFSLIACTSLRAVSPTESTTDMQKDIRVGDTVEVTTAAGARRVLTVTSVDVGQLTGTDSNGQPASVDLSKVSQLEVKKISAVKTGGAVLGTVGAVLLVVGALFVAAIIHSLD